MEIIQQLISILGSVTSFVIVGAMILAAWIITSIILHYKLGQTDVVLPILVWIPVFRFLALLRAANWRSEFFILIILEIFLFWFAPFAVVAMFLLSITNLIIWFKIGWRWNSLLWGIVLGGSSVFFPPLTIFLFAFMEIKQDELLMSF